MALRFVDVSIMGPQPLRPGECYVCGAQPDGECIPECDEDDMIPDRVALLAAFRVIEKMKRLS